MTPATDGERWRRTRLPGRGVAVASLVAWLAGVICSPAVAESEKKYRARVVLFVAEGLVLSDIVAEPTRLPGPGRPQFYHPIASELPGLRALVRHGAVGLMSPAVVGRVTPQSACLTLGAGTRAASSESLSRAFDVDTEVDGIVAGEWFRKQTGTAAPGGSVVNLGAQEAARFCADRHSLARPGALGDWLKANNLTAGVYGNADHGGAPRRHVTAILMDAAGVVPKGSVERALSEGGVREREDAAREFDQLVRECDVIAVDLGGPGPARNSGDPKQDAVARHGAVGRMDAVLRGLLGHLNPWKTNVLFLSTVPDDLRVTKMRLTPWILVQPQETFGLLTSASTKRLGLVTNADLAPTVIGLLGGKAPPEMVGRRVEVGELSPLSAWGHVIRLEARSAKQSRLAPGFTLTGLLLGGAAVLLASLVLGFRQRLRPVWKARSRVLLLSAMALPFAAHVLAPAYPDSSFLRWGGLVGLAILVGAFSYASGGKRLGALCLVSGLSVWLVTADLLCGGPLMSCSIMGTNAVWFRFYGLGNPSLGVLLACLLLLSGAVLSLRPNWWRSVPLRIIVLAVSGGLVVLVGLPQCGANLGGTLTCAMAVAFAAATLMQPTSPLRKRLLFSVAASVVVAAVVVATDVLTGSGERTHLAGAWTAFRELGVSAPLTIWQRKMAHNLWMLTLSPLTYGLLATFALFSYFVYQPVGLLESAWQRHPALRAAFFAMPVAGVTAFLLNDTGLAIVAALSLIVGPALVYVLLETAEDKELG